MKLARLMKRLGRLCFILMWIPFTTLMISVSTTTAPGDYAWSELPVLSQYSIMALMFFVIADVVFSVGGLVVGGVANRSVRARGRPASATVLRVWDTGTTINDDPLVRLSLQVHPPDQPSFQAEAECIISRLQIPQIQPGAVVQVKYDPRSRAVALA